MKMQSFVYIFVDALRFLMFIAIFLKCTIRTPHNKGVRKENEILLTV